MKMFLKKIIFTVSVLFSAAGLFVLSQNVTDGIGSFSYDDDGEYITRLPENDAETASEDSGERIFEKLSKSSINLICVFVFMVCTAAVITIFITDRQKPLWFAVIYIAAILAGIFIPLIKAIVF